MYMKIDNTFGSVIKCFISIAILSLLLLLISACENSSFTSHENYFYNNLKGKINEGKTQIYLNDLTNFQWDKVIYLGPYSGEITKGEFNFQNKTYLYDGNLKVDLMNDSLYCWCFNFINQDKIIAIIRGKYIARGDIHNGIFNKSAILVINNTENPIRFYIKENIK